MTPASLCMIDTNILVYSTVSGNPWHEESRNWLTTLRNQGIMLCATPQILREYMVVLTRGLIFERQFTVDEVLEAVNGILPWLRVLDETDKAAGSLRDLIRRYQIRGKHVHDANIVAVMLAHGVTRLATFNRVDFDGFREIVLEPLS
jgi:predicted nucleic acid-binding protein